MKAWYSFGIMQLKAKPSTRKEDKLNVEIQKPASFINWKVKMKMKTVEISLLTKYAIQAAFPLTKDNSFRLIMPELQ